MLKKWKKLKLQMSKKEKISFEIENIKDPTFLKSLNIKELQVLADEIRSFLIKKISKTGGHLASNLGSVELTIALHYVFNSPADSLIFDVGHQIYTHKILTGRAKEFDTLRKHQGLSGYASYSESVHDKWESGHAGTSISAMVGYLQANEILNKKTDVVSVVGDASIINGTNMEALNFLGNSKNKKGIILLNDNNMSISKNVGAFSVFLSQLRGSKITNWFRKLFDKILPNFFYKIGRRIKRSLKAIFQTRNMFEDMGYVYIGPIDGHNIKRIIKTLQSAKRINKSVVIHAITKKGLGYELAEVDEKGSYHGVPAFDKSAGLIINNGKDKTSWSEGISEILQKYAEEKDLYVLIPAMIVGGGFLEFEKKYPKRIIDVGIAEEHAAVMSAALALNKINVFLALYSTFSQRAYDQILNDIARVNLKVVIGIDRAGFVGEDGSTHQGLYDVSMFLSMPNVTVTMPKDLKEAAGLIKYAYDINKGPFVIRYPRGFVKKEAQIEAEPIGPSWEQLTNKELGFLISYGPVLNYLEEVIEKENLGFSLINARYINPIDENLLKTILKTNKPVVVYEETHASGALYQKILDFMARYKYTNKIKSLSVYNKVINHGTVSDNRLEAKLDKEQIVKALKEIL